MPELQISIVRFIDDWQPGFVECQVTDVDGRVWTFREKVPLVTDEYLDSKSTYPCGGQIGCRILNRTGEIILVGVNALAEGSEIDTEYFECEVLASAVIEISEGDRPRHLSP